jgi:hypothetical protein
MSAKFLLIFSKGCQQKKRKISSSRIGATNKRKNLSSLLVMSNGAVICKAPAPLKTKYPLKHECHFNS